MSFVPQRILLRLTPIVDVIGLRMSMQTLTTGLFALTFVVGKQHLAWRS